jgi:phosphatidylglycerol---prolipoprotein diacylglyceryl transferase
MRELIHIYGPFSIYSYGVAIAFGILTFMWFVQHDPRFKKLNLEKYFTNIIGVGVALAIIGGRGLALLSSHDPFNFWDLFVFWQGGMSILGAIICVLLFGSFYLRIIKIPILPLLDLIAIYAGILQGFGRIGCFFAGCCYGLPTKLGWAICYTDSNTSAPIGIWMHPTQLYSSIIFFSIFLLMYFILQYKLTKPGQLTTMYLMLASAERFIVGFWRADKEFFANPALSFLSINQFIALGILSSASIAFIYFTLQPKHS